jgi:hypothetical protein
MFALKTKQFFAASVSLLILGASSVVAAAPATTLEAPQSHSQLRDLWICCSCPGLCTSDPKLGFRVHP